MNLVSMNSTNSITAFQDILNNNPNAGDFTAVRLDSSSGKAKLVAFNTSLLRRNVARFARDGSAAENYATRTQLIEALRGEGASEGFLEEMRKYLGLGDNAARSTSSGKPLLLREIRQVLTSFAQVQKYRTSLEHIIDERSRTLSEKEFPQALADGLKRHIAQAPLEELERIAQKFEANVLVPVPNCVDRIEVTWRSEQSKALESFLSNEYFGGDFFVKNTRDMAFNQIALDTPRGTSLSINGTPVRAPADPDSKGYSPDERAAIERLMPETTPENLKTVVLHFANQTALNSLSLFMHQNPVASLVDLAPKSNGAKHVIKISSQGSETNPVFRCEVEIRSSDFRRLKLGDEAVGADCMDPRRLYQNRAVFLIDLDEKGKPRVRLEAPPVTILDFGRALDAPTAQRLNGERLQAFFADPASPTALRDYLKTDGIVLTEAECAALLADNSLRKKMTSHIAAWSNEWASGLNASMILKEFVTLSTVRDTAAAQREENRNLSRAITAQDVDAFLARRLAACAAAMGLDPAPAAQDLRRALASDVAQRVAAATQKVTVPGAVFEVLLEKSLRRQLLGRQVLADFAEERQALVASTPGMPPVEDILVWNAIRSTETFRPELFARLETAEGDELAAAQAECQNATKARARSILMLNCAKFRALSKAEARVLEILGTDRPADVAPNLEGLRNMLSLVSVPKDFDGRDAAAFDDLVAPSVDRFVNQKQAQIASVRGLNLPQDAPLRTLLVTQVMKTTRIKFATAPVRVAKVAAAIGTPPLSKTATVDELLTFVRTVYERMNRALVGEEAQLDPSDVETFRNYVFEAFCVLHPEIEQTFGALPKTVIERARERLDTEIGKARDEDASHRAGAQLNVIAYMGDIADEARAARVEQARNLVDVRLQAKQEEIEARLESLLCAWPDAADGMRGALLEGVRMRCQRVIPVWAAERSLDADAVRAMVDGEVNAFIAELAGTASARLGALTSAPAALALLGAFTDNFDRVLRYLAQVAQTKPGALTPDGLRADIAVRLGAPILDTDTLDVALDRLDSDSAFMAVVARASVKKETMRAYLAQAFYRLPPAEVPKGDALDAVLDAAERRAGKILEELLAERLAVSFADGELEALLRTATRRAVVETLLRQEERTRSESAEALMTSPVWQTRMRLAADDASQFAQLKADFHFATWRGATRSPDVPRVRETSPEAAAEPQEAGPGRAADLLVDLEEVERRAVDLLSEMPLDRASAASFMLETVQVRRALEQMIATIEEAGEWEEVSAEDAEALRHEAARFVDLLDVKSAALAALDGGHPVSYSAIEDAESIWHIAAVSVLLTKMEALGDDLVLEVALALEEDTKAFLAKAQGNPTAPCPKELVEERLKDPLGHLMDIVDDVFRRKARFRMSRGDRQELRAKIFAEWQRTLNRRSWTPIDKSFVTTVDRQPIVARSVITPARHLGDPLSSSYRGDRLGGVMCHCYDSRHAVNLAHSSFSVKTGDGEPQEVFAGLRHGVHSARGIANPAERKTANRMRAEEVVQAARITRQDPNAPRGDVNADLHLTSISLLTPDVFRKGTGSNEREMLQEQVEAWKAVEGLSQGKTHVITFNFGVNAGAVGTFSPVTGGWGLSDKLNGDAMKKLTARCTAFRETHPDSKHLAHIETLLTQLEDLLKNHGEHRDEHDAYKAAARVAVITYLIGDTPCWNCKSGKDRTGEMDVECKFLATLVALNQPIPEPGAPLTEEQKLLFREIALEGGNLELQVYNTGLAGFKTKGVDSIPERLGSDEAAALHKGASSFVAV